MLVQTPGAAAAEAEPVELSEGQKALAAAKESGERVEVVGQRSEQTTVYANPDGYTFTLQESSVPVRVARTGGGWQKPDATLEKRADGSVAPKAAAPQIVFSGGGGAEPLARISRQGRSVELTWPDSLPEPTVDGASAVYADVLPGVDLKVTATVESFQHVLVVKTPEAAANEKLKKLTFGLKTAGLKLEEGASGNLAAIDADGRTVFKAPPARMWNSAGAKESPQPAGVSSRSAPDATASSDPAETAPSGSGLEPGQGDQVAKMDVEVDEDTLSIVPDAQLLEEKDAAAFPLFIDPSVTWGESERTLLRSDGYEDYAWGNGDDDQGKGAGECGSWNGYYCGPGYVQRLYFEFSPASLKGKHVLDATFRVTEPWSFQCEPRWVDLVRTNNISSSTTWGSRPKELDWMGDRHVSAGRADMCSPGLPNAAIEFNDNPEETNENLAPTVKDFAAGKFSRLTLEIRAHDEGDTSAWKRFRNDAVLEVSFVGIPDKPTGIGLVTGSGTVCSTTESNPTIVSDPTPSLTATTQTKSGGEEDAQLRVFFDVDRKNTDGTWADTNAGTNDARPSTGYAADGKKQIISWSTLTEGPVHRYRAWTQSFYNDGKSHLSGPSNGSTTGFCYFKVDPTAPKAPKITLGSPYKECLPNDCAGRGGPGQKATFGFAPATGDTGVVSYQYTLSGMTTWPTVNGSTASVQLTPEREGTFTLWARAKDNVGRYGAWNAVDFLVAAGPGPVGRWHFDEADGAAINSAASTAGRHGATLGGGAVRDDRGRRGVITHDAQGLPLANPVTDKGLALNGTSGYAATSGPVLETRSAFTVAAWVRLDKKGADATVLGQRGALKTPFTFRYLASADKWYFGMMKADASQFWGQYSAYPAEVGVWTHLAATYDPATDELVFYVDGRRQGQVLKPGAGSWESAGPLQIGRQESVSGGFLQYFPGSIDEVAVWQTVLTHQQIADEGRALTSEQFAGVELMAEWDADRGSGTTVADTTSGYGKSLTLTGGATLDGEAIVLDGVDDAATAAGPLVYDHAAFTVSTRVQLDGAALVGKDVGYTGQVLGQRTADGSAWGFWYELTGKGTELDEETLEERTVPLGVWHFGRLNADGTWSSVASEQVAALDTPVRVTGIYDSMYGTISLHLGYNQEGDAKDFTVQLGTGDFAIGKGFTGGTWKHFLPARVEEVRLWAGAMASPEQIDEHVGD
ncbi:LamG domain-containing protein [Streptomyces sp. NBC_00059]|uniref:LamG domain-containing protein n=1 Tax=Streptomyces sp. NBC_00059 TaxID=2975635 RepID=UPI0022516633|nr:LamG domain-containing protein [Streptomyces sp. NBC_00059]MCX5417291.1 LamG domain-containing protein [Streptomyces sp. NBC_00059]